MINRFVVIVIDSLGIGAMPDAGKFNDLGADTFGHLLSNTNLSFPNLEKLGLYNLIFPPSGKRVLGSYAKMMCASPAKDSIAGHWELAGLILDKPLITYPNGFPKPLVEEFERRIGSKTIGNSASSGTEIIKRLGEEHIRTLCPIIYTSADSVFQIAAHEEKFGLNKLYKICCIARKMLTGKNSVGRVIARPFTGLPGNFRRTENRKDLALSPFKPTLLDKIKGFGGEVIAVGKITDLFNGEGITKSVHTDNNIEGMNTALAEVSKSPKKTPSLIFTNLVDFDMLWGHRRDIAEYARGLKYFDDFLPKLQDALKDTDVLCITADHGCDPAYLKHTDHTREYVPLLLYGKQIRNGINLGIRNSFSDLAQTIADIFNIGKLENGKSMKAELVGKLNNL
ncbi:MAG: phosphopentomutase [Elusimicrobia bacterium]|nr:phosphopentomutase [Candidatus Liberimonas magnetica]